MLRTQRHRVTEGCFSFENQKIIEKSLCLRFSVFYKIKIILLLPKQSESHLALHRQLVVKVMAERLLPSTADSMLHTEREIGEKTEMSLYFQPG